MELLHKTVLITGAAGFIGSNIVKEYLKNGFTVYAVIHNHLPPEFQNNENIKILKCDLTQEKEITSLYESLDVKPEIVVHVAGLASDVGKEELFKKLNYESLITISKLFTKKLIYISSTDVYGIKDFSGESEEELPFDEYPRNPYPRYKIKSELYLGNNIDPSKYVIIRPAAVWGEGDKTLESRFVNFLRISPFIVHFGKWKGQNRWPLANVTTLAKVVFQVGLTDKYNGQAINIIDSKRTSIDEYYREVARKYFPDRHYTTVTLPFGIGRLLGMVSSFLSNVLGCKQPVFDPSYYALHHISSNLDFDNTKMLEVLKKQ